MTHDLYVILDYFLEDIIQMLDFMPPPQEKRKGKGRGDDDDGGEEMEQEVRIQMSVAPV